tara:strand:- start:1352 stop:1903 length:552 start_codon:yes stop_codon:yes gene_type:complete
MARVKQFASDLGISKNQAQTLINKGRSRKDGGSQIMESHMPIYFEGMDKKKVPTPKPRPKNLKKKNKKKDPFRADKTESLDKKFSAGVTATNKKAMENVAKLGKTSRKADKGGGPVPTPTDSRDRRIKRKTTKYYAGGGSNSFPDLTGDGKVTQKDILKGRGVPGFSRGGGIAIQGLGFKGVR